VGKAELTGLVHGAETRARARGERATTLTDEARGTEREWGARMREADADRLAPLGRGREGASTRGHGLAPIGGVHLLGRERARAGLGRAGLN
jgi:hypothetical protein